MLDIYVARLMAKGKTPREQYMNARERLKECRDAYAQAQSDLIEAERWVNETEAACMNDLFPPTNVK